MSVSRRSLLSALGIAAAAPAAVGLAKPAEPEGRFEHPSEYLAAMRAIGWRPVAMYQRLEAGGVHPMDVKETAPSEQHVAATWKKYHAISMRSPVQMAADRPQGEWWNAVWQYLYDKGLREDVTPSKLATRLDGLMMARAEVA